MTTKEIKSEIQKALDNIPESVLQDILDYLKAIQDKSADKLKLGKNLRNILIEDKELLEKLAKWSAAKKLRAFTRFSSRNLEAQAE